MSVACVEMIQAKVGGVAYTRHPFQAGKNHIIINAAWGLGAYVVDGMVTPDMYALSKTDSPTLLETQVASKLKRLVVHPGGYGAHSMGQRIHKCRTTCHNVAGSGIGATRRIRHSRCGRGHELIRRKGGHYHQVDGLRAETGIDDRLAGSDDAQIG